MALEADLARLGGKLARISGVEYERANAKALNNSGSQTRTRSIRGIANENNLKQKTIKDRYFLNRATANKQRVRISVYLRPVSAISQFSPSQLKRAVDGKGTTRRGVTIAGRKIASAFIARGPKNNQRQVFKRRGKTRLKIDAQKFDINQSAARITTRVSQRIMRTVYPRLLQHEFQFRINKLRS